MHRQGGAGEGARLVGEDVVGAGGRVVDDGYGEDGGLLALAEAAI